MKPDKHGYLYEAAPRVKNIVSHYYHVFNGESAPVTKHLSPNLEMMLILNFGPGAAAASGNEQHNITQATAIGPLRKMLTYTLPPGADALVINFHLNGFYRLFSQPLTERSGVFNDVQLPYLEELRQEITDRSITERIELLEDFICSLAAGNEEQAEPLLRGKDYFHDPVIQPVKAIAADTHLTERSIQLRFKKYVGYSPKELLRFLRFKAVINFMLQQPQADIFDVIETFSYHDQSHLIKDFRHFLDSTPQQFIKHLRDREFYVTGQARDNQDQKNGA
jgi:AraC-like DNA-binding protein